MFMNAQEGFIADFSIKKLLYNPFRLFSELFFGRNENLMSGEDNKNLTLKNTIMWKRIIHYLHQRTKLTLNLDDPVTTIYDRMVFCIILVSLIVIGKKYLSITFHNFASLNRSKRRNSTNQDNNHNTIFPIPLWVSSFSFLFLPFSPLCGSFMSYSRFVLVGALPLLWFYSVEKLHQENKKLFGKDVQQCAERSRLNFKPNQWICIGGLIVTTILQIFALRRFLLSKWLC